MKQFILLLIGLYFFTGCDTDSTTSNNTLATRYKAFFDNKKLWEETKTRNYSFVVEKSCFCPYKENKQVTVDNTKIIESKFIPSNALINVNTEQKNIDGYFDIIQNALDKNVYKLVVKYDKIYGYPTEIHIDYDEQIVDEEVHYTLTHFNPTIDGRIVCTHEYLPVCASVNIQCVTTPCETVEETFSNKCMFNANPNATYIKDGEC